MEYSGYISEAGRLRNLSSCIRFLSQEELKVMAIHESKSVAYGLFKYFLLTTIY